MSLRLADPVLGPFVRAMKDAMEAYTTMRREGISRPEAIDGLESVIRDVWPKGREREWVYYCSVCSDIGYEDLTCRAYARCQRRACDTKGEDWAHRYVVACSCAKGQAYAPKVGTVEDALAGAAKVKRRKSAGGFSRMGG